MTSHASGARREPASPGRLNPRPLMRPALLSLLLLSLSASAQTDTTTPLGTGTGTLVVLDSFCCQTASAAAHDPDLGPRWTTTGPGTVEVKAGYLHFDGQGGAALIDAPDRNQTAYLFAQQPHANPAPISLSYLVRYADPDNHVAVRFTWSSASGRTGTATAELVVTTAGAALVAGSFAAFSRSAHPGRTVALAVRDVRSSLAGSPPALDVWADGVHLGHVASSDHLAARAVGVRATATQPDASGHVARIADLAITAHPTAFSPVTLPGVCPGLSALDARACIRQAFAPIAPTGYDEARDRLFEWVWARGAGSSTRTVDGIYGGAYSIWSWDDARSPREQVQDDGFNTEHIWPRSRGAQPYSFTDAPPHNDLHHLAPAFGLFNSARSNRPFGDSFDTSADETLKWLQLRSVRYTASSPAPPLNPTTWSRVERNHLAGDDGDGFTSVDELGRFDVRHHQRGDVARAAAYFLTLYQIEAEDADEGRAFIGATLDVLLRWHQDDPVSPAERLRNERIYVRQGNRNPYVLDETLLERALYDPTRTDPNPPLVWINEVHHSNSGFDVGEGIELAGEAGTPLYGYRVWLYSGYGRPYSAAVESSPSAQSVAFRGAIDAEAGAADKAIGAVWATAEGLRGGCQGLALFDPDGRLVQFLSYGGCRFNALSGPVYDYAAARGAADPSHPDSLVWSTPIRGRSQRPVQEWSTLPPGHSVQLTGAGTAYADFTWGGPHVATPGRLGDYQAPARAANPVSGYHAGLRIPDGLLGPLLDTGHDEDQPAAGDESVRPDAQQSAEAFALSAPYPNPAAGRAQLDVVAPPSADVAAAVIDVLGRTVLRAQRTGPGPLVFDLSRLAPGIYGVRAALSGQRAEPLTHRLTVLR